MSRLLIGLLSLTAALSASITPVPEPSTYIMIGAGLGVLIYARNRATKKK